MKPLLSSLIFMWDWEEAAKDALRIGRDAPWTKGVGKWVAQQLKAAGFSGNNVLAAGHSWGSLVSYEIGESFKYGPDGNNYGIQALVALDTPLDPLPNGYPINSVVFNDVSNVSWALRSSFFGSEARSNTADFNFELPGLYDDIEDQFLPPEQKLLLDAAQAYFGEHGYAVSYFANLINGFGDSSLDLLDIQKLLDGGLLNMPVDSSAPEGILPYILQQSSGPNGTYWQAVPTSLLDPPE